MTPIFFESQEELQRAADDLERLGPRARRALAELVETQGFERAQISPTIHALVAAGFVDAREPDYATGKARIAPRLWGEEALEALEERLDAAKAATKSSPRARLKA